MIVFSRAFELSVDGVKTDGFVPFADMLNHKNEGSCQTTWTYSDERQGFIIEACQDIPKGHEVFNSYGTKSNSKLFLNYGFVSTNSDAINEVPMKIYLKKGDPLLKFKQKFINFDKPFMNFNLVDSLDDPVMFKFINWLRYIEFEGDTNILETAKKEFKEV